jgi:hypothetical protein
LLVVAAQPQQPTTRSAFSDVVEVKAMLPLQVYVSANCAVCQRTRSLIATVRAQHPEYPIELIELDQPGATRPDYVFGTPTFVLNDRIVFLGNPALDALIDLLQIAAD